MLFKGLNIQAAIAKTDDWAEINLNNRAWKNLGDQIKALDPDNKRQTHLNMIDIHSRIATYAMKSDNPNHKLQLSTMGLDEQDASADKFKLDLQTIATEILNQCASRKHTVSSNSLSLYGSWMSLVYLATRTETLLTVNLKALHEFIIYGTGYQEEKDPSRVALPVIDTAFDDRTFRDLIINLPKPNDHWKERFCAIRLLFTAAWASERSSYFLMERKVELWPKLSEKLCHKIHRSHKMKHVLSAEMLSKRTKNELTFYVERGR